MATSKLINSGDTSNKSNAEAKSFLFSSNTLLYVITSFNVTAILVYHVQF